MLRSRTLYVYILASRRGTLYIGVTNNLGRRMYEHKHGLVPGFTNKYKVNRLVYFEEFNRADDAIAREKQLKGWSRRRKVALIESLNPRLKDLTGQWLGDEGGLAGAAKRITVAGGATARSFDTAARCAAGSG